MGSDSRDSKTKKTPAEVARAIRIAPRNTPEGKKQREDFLNRYGVDSADLGSNVGRFLFRMFN